MGCVRPSPTIFPSRTTTAPTDGRGDTSPSPDRPSSMARSMCCRWPGAPEFREVTTSRPDPHDAHRNRYAADWWSDLTGPGTGCPVRWIRTVGLLRSSSVGTKSGRCAYRSRALSAGGPRLSALTSDCLSSPDLCIQRWSGLRVRCALARLNLNAYRSSKLARTS